MGGEIETFCERHGLESRLEGAWRKLRICPYCKGGSAGRDLYTLALHTETGAGRCHRASCGWVGGLAMLRREFGDLPAERAMPAPTLAPALATRPEVMPNWEGPHRMLLRDTAALTALLEQRGITPLSVRRFGVGMISDRGSVAYTFPFRDQHGELSYLKTKAKMPDGQRTVFREPRRAMSVLYGGDRLEGNDRCVIVEGEEDCILLTQAAVPNVVSLPDGASLTATNRPPWLAAIEGFSEFVLCLDNDAAGKKGQTALAAILGADRCRIVTYPDARKDACEYGRDVQLLVAAINQAELPGHPLVSQIGSSDLAAELRAAWKSPTPHGVSTGLKSLDALLGGIRPGEITILTGHTGSGKSALATAIGLNLATAGHAVLLASLELTTTDVMWRVIQQITGKLPWRRTPDEAHLAMTEADLDSALVRLAALPFHILRRFGQLSPVDFGECVKFATRRFGAKLHILDHLHFATAGAGENERHALNDAMFHLKTIARDTNTHLLVVAHPSRSARDKPEPAITDLQGSAALEQTADNVLTVRRMDEGARVSLKKLRQGRSGKQGYCDLLFDAYAEQYREKDFIHEGNYYEH